MAAQPEDALARGSHAADAVTPPLGVPSLAAGGAAPAGEPTRILAPEEAPALHAWLEDDAGRRLDLEGPGPFLLGRSEECHWREDSRTVSRRHARIERVAGGFAIEDLESLNGTRVNGQRVPRTLLADGDRIGLGGRTLRFRCRLAGAAPAPGPSPASTAGRGGPMGRRSRLLAGAGLAALVLAAALAYRLLPAPGPGPVQPQAAPGEASPPAAGRTETPQGSVKAPAAVPPPKGAAGAVARAERERPGSASGRDATPSAPRPAPKASRPARARAPAVSRPRPPGPDAGPRPPQRPSAAGGDPVAAALARYRAGDVDGALDALARIAAAQGPAARRARALRADLVALDTLYRQGAEAFERGDAAAAARIWLRLVEAEHERFGDAGSARVREVRRRVAAHYAERGRMAAGEGRTRDAWRLWRRAAALDPEGEGARELARLRAEARRLYREGYRLETVDLERAREAWRRLIGMAPPDDPYRIKAEARLAWHERLEALRR